MPLVQLSLGVRPDAIRTMDPAKPSVDTRRYDTRIDRFRWRAGIAPGEWATAAEMPRSQLLRYRTGEDHPRCSVLARLVRAAGALTASAVRAVDLYDLGDDEPLGVASAPLRPSKVRKAFDTRLDRLLVRNLIRPNRLAAQAQLSCRLVLRLRSEDDDPRLATVASLVRALRRMGVDVRAQDLFDVGDE